MVLKDLDKNVSYVDELTLSSQTGQSDYEKAMAEDANTKNANPCSKSLGGKIASDFGIPGWCSRGAEHGIVKVHDPPCPYPINSSEWYHDCSITSQIRAIEQDETNRRKQKCNKKIDSTDDLLNDQWNHSYSSTDKSCHTPEFTAILGAEILAGIEAGQAAEEGKSQDNYFHNLRSQNGGNKRKKKKKKYTKKNQRKFKGMQTGGTNISSGEGLSEYAKSVGNKSTDSLASQLFYNLTYNNNLGKPFDEWTQVIIPNLTIYSKENISNNSTPLDISTCVILLRSVRPQVQLMIDASCGTMLTPDASFSIPASTYLTGGKKLSLPEGGPPSSLCQKLLYNSIPATDNVFLQKNPYGSSDSPFEECEAILYLNLAAKYFYEESSGANHLKESAQWWPPIANDPPGFGAFSWHLSLVKI